MIYPPGKKIKVRMINGRVTLPSRLIARQLTIDYDYPHRRWAWATVTLQPKHPRGYRRSVSLLRVARRSTGPR